jgi:hypothetical protein
MKNHKAPGIAACLGVCDRSIRELVTPNPNAARTENPKQRQHEDFGAIIVPELSSRDDGSPICPCPTFTLL